MADNEEQTKFHPVIELMLRRMESFPDEFRKGQPRWRATLEALHECATDKEVETLVRVHKRLLMDEAHEIAMNELCNGDTRQKANHNPNKRKKESSGDLPTDRRLV